MKLEEFVKIADAQIKLYDEADEKTEYICYTLDGFITLECSLLMNENLKNILTVLNQKKQLKSDYIAIYTKTLELYRVYKLRKTINGVKLIFQSFIYSKQK